LVFERDLFVESLDDILAGDNRFIKIDSGVSKQAVFVTAAADGSITPDKEMGYGALSRGVSTFIL
jgi:hypothetical protein